MQIFGMVSSSGPVVLGVLLSLIFLSLLCWTVVLVKMLQFRKVERKNGEFIELFETTGNLEDLGAKAEKMQDYSPMASLFTAAMEQLKHLARSSRSGARPVPVALAVEMIEREMESSIRLDMKDLEYAVPILATTGNTAPFIGLFGTVWGIMNSFHEIGIKGSASLATVAPGISEALVATATGLAAAIPAVMAFNLFTTKLQRMEKELESFKDAVLNRLELEWFARTAANPNRIQDGDAPDMRSHERDHPRENQSTGSSRTGWEG